jgi:hypothetical protein
MDALRRLPPARLYRNLQRNYLGPYRRAGTAAKPVLQVARELAGLWWRWRRIPEHYFRLALYLKAPPKDVTTFLPRAMVYDALERVNPPEAVGMVLDKVRFHRVMHARGLPSVPTLFLGDPGGGLRDPDGAPVAPAEALRRIAAAGGRAFAKPVDGRSGEGARIFDRATDDLERFVAPPRSYMFQPLIRQHPMLAEVHPGSVNPIRIDTLLRTDGTCVHSGAVLRMGVGGSITDATGTGGLMVPIDRETGQLGRLARSKPKYGNRLFERHPDTGVTFAAIRLPFWEEVLATVRQGALALRPLVSIGWDVALTEDGPLLIEANHRWSPEPFQLFDGLRDTPIGALALERPDWRWSRRRAAAVRKPPPAPAAR